MERINLQRCDPYFQGRIESVDHKYVPVWGGATGAPGCC